MKLLNRMIKVIQEDQFVQTSGEDYAFYDADMYLSLVLDLDLDEVEFLEDSSVAKFNFGEEVIELPISEMGDLTESRMNGRKLIKYQ